MRHSLSKDIAFNGETNPRYKTRTGKYGLGIKHGLGIKRGLRTGYKIRTTDYFGRNGANWF